MAEGANGKLTRRGSDRFPVLWLRRLAFALIPALISGVGLLWADRQAKIAAIQTNSLNLASITIRLDTLEQRVTENREYAAAERKEIIEEIRDLRVEVREMYRRAIRAR